METVRHEVSEDVAVLCIWLAAVDVMHLPAFIHCVAPLSTPTLHLIHLLFGRDSYTLSGNTEACLRCRPRNLAEPCVDLFESLHA